MPLTCLLFLLTPIFQYLSNISLREIAQNFLENFLKDITICSMIAKFRDHKMTFPFRLGKEFEIDRTRFLVQYIIHDPDKTCNMLK